MGADTAPFTKPRRRKSIPYLWLGLSFLWAGVILATDEPAWPLALWIATTVGPLTLLRSRTTTPRALDEVTSPELTDEGAPE